MLTGGGAGEASEGGGVGGVPAGAADLLDPARVYSRDEVRARPSPVPARAGVYAWYFDEIPPGVPTEGCRVAGAGTLLYVGIAPREPPADGSAPSRQNLRTRVRAHFTGNAAGSSLRLMLGCHLAERLGIELRAVNERGTRLTFTEAGEARLSEWMGAHARVAFTTVDEPWTLERRLIEEQVLPLNVAHNARSPHHRALKDLLANHRRRARALAVVPD